MSTTRVIEQMPDGSTAVFDTETLTVHSLNAGAAAAFAACGIARWGSTPAWSAFPRYLAAFLDARGAVDLTAKLWDRTRDLLARRA